MKSVGLSSTTSPNFPSLTVIVCLVLALPAGFLPFQSSHCQSMTPLTSILDTGSNRPASGEIGDSCSAFSVFISADPESAQVIIDRSDSVLRLPTRLVFTGKKLDIRVLAAGYEPLSYQLQCVNADSVSLLFSLRSVAPPLLVAESIGLALLPIQVVLDSGAADHRMKSYSNAAEMFAIFPFGQGVITRVLSGDTYRKESNALMLSGAALSVGCLIAGKMLSGHQRSSIRRKNEKIIKENNSSLMQNQEVDRKVKIANRARKTLWERENKSRGIVAVMKFP